MSLMIEIDQLRTELAAAREAFRELREKFDDSLLKFGADIVTVADERDTAIRVLVEIRSELSVAQSFLRDLCSIGGVAEEFLVPHFRETTADLAAARKLLGKWESEWPTYPKTEQGEFAAATVRLCIKELLDAAKEQTGSVVEGPYLGEVPWVPIVNAKEKP